MSERAWLPGSVISRRNFAQLLTVGTAAWLAPVAFGSRGKMLRFETRADPFSRGRQQGEVCRDLFHPWMNHLLQERAEQCGLSTPVEVVNRFRKDVERWRHYLEAVYPEGIQECSGIAKGLNLDEATYLTVHFNYRLRRETRRKSSLSTGSSNFKYTHTPQCTVFGLRDGEGRPLVGKTDDIAKWELGMNVLETVRPDKGYRHVHFHFAGTIWSVAGMNERGLVMAMTGIAGPESEEKGMDGLAALRPILPACATVREAISFIRETRFNYGGFSLMLADAEGTLSLVEKSAAGMVVFPEKKRSGLLHTNEIRDATFAGKNPPARGPIRKNSLRRYENGLVLLKKGGSMEHFLSDRSSQGAICQQGEDGMYTDFAVILAPVEKKIQFWPGCPGDVEPEMMELGRIFT